MWELRSYVWKGSYKRSQFQAYIYDMYQGGKRKSLNSRTLATNHLPTSRIGRWIACYHQDCRYVESVASHLWLLTLQSTIAFARAGFYWIDAAHHHPSLTFLFNHSKSPEIISFNNAFTWILPYKLLITRAVLESYKLLLLSFNNP